MWNHKLGGDIRREEAARPEVAAKGSGGQGGRLANDDAVGGVGSEDWQWV